MIDHLLLITGAGASLRLGMDGLMPLMTDWSKFVVSTLNQAEPGLADAFGLTQTAGGEEFEQRLGNFLRWHRSLPFAASLPALGWQNLYQAEPVSEMWFERAATRGKQVSDTLHRTLHDLFGAARINRFAAETVYREFLESLPGQPVANLTYATTNYDVAGEIALEALGRRPYWGVDSSMGGRVAVRGHDLMSMPGRSAVLHLHGRVGWYRDRDTGQVFEENPAHPFSEHLGQPALLLPDPDKDYAEEPLVSDIWRQLDVALSNASHIFVVGHSLHDRRLVEVLRPQSGRVAVSVLPQEAVAGSDSLLHVRSLLPDSHIVGVDFGASPSIATPDYVNAWQDRRGPML